MGESRARVVESEASPTPPTLTRLDRAIRAWAARGNSGPLELWFDREVDGQGLPRALEPSWTWELLNRLAGAVEQRAEDWPEPLDARVEGLARFARNLLRGDGSTLLESVEAPARHEGILRFWADRLADPTLGQAADWLDRIRPGHARPTSNAWLDSFAADRGPLAILRSRLTAASDPGADLIAIDHLSRPDHCRLELIGRGRGWLGRSWESAEPLSSRSRPKRTVWRSNDRADLLEWTFQSGASRIHRTAVLLRRERLALLADHWQGPATEARMEVGLAPGVSATLASAGRGVVLRGPGGSARVWPIGLSEDKVGEGSRILEDRLELHHPMSGRRCWLPLVVSWDPSRNRRPVLWRPLTVSERARIRPPWVAFAARLGWGAGREGLVVYRSLARAAPRVFLGHQTRARMLIGLFTTEGEVVPLVQID